MQIKKLYELAIKKWGRPAQLVKCAEECSELIKICCKISLGGPIHFHNLAEELADVKIMIEQIEQAFNVEGYVEDYRQQKLEHLKSILENDD
mgnify:CR=1 FL=1